MRIVLKILFYLVVILLVLAAIAAGVGYLVSVPQSLQQKEKIASSPHYSEGEFANLEPQAPFEFKLGDLTSAFASDPSRYPAGKIPVVTYSSSLLEEKPKPGLRVTWLGHAASIVEIDGVRVLIDPVLGERASPFDFAGPKRFHPPPIEAAALRNIDAVLISHDHYDHLEKLTLQLLSTADLDSVFLVPLGLGELIERWSIPKDRIIEVDWWDEFEIKGVRLIATPARHYSNRGIFDYLQTQWLSWSLVGPKHRVFYSGDTGYAKVFTEIGERLGPFDLTMLKISAYGPGKPWMDVHMNPEEAVQVHRDVGGEVMLPYSWATFNLAYHPWDEPIKRALAAAADADVELITPRIGETVDLADPYTNTNWWEEAE